MAMAMITDPSWLLWVTNEPTTHWTLWPGAQPLRMAGDDFDNGQHLQSATWWFCPFSACTTKISTKINQPVVGSTCSHFFSKSFSRCENHKWFTPIITDVYTDEFLPMWFCIGSQRQRHCKENGSVGITSLHFVSECMSFTQWMYNLYWDSDSDEMSWAQTKFYLAASICHSSIACWHLGKLWRQPCTSSSRHFSSAFPCYGCWHRISKGIESRVWVRIRECHCNCVESERGERFGIREGFGSRRWYRFWDRWWWSQWLRWVSGIRCFAGSTSSCRVDAWNLNGFSWCFAVAIAIAFHISALPWATPSSRLEAYSFFVLWRKHYFEITVERRAFYPQPELLSWKNVPACFVQAHCLVALTWDLDPTSVELGVL